MKLFLATPRAIDDLAAERDAHPVRVIDAAALAREFRRVPGTSAREIAAGIVYEASLRARTRPYVIRLSKRLEAHLDAYCGKIGWEIVDTRESYDKRARVAAL